MRFRASRRSSSSCADPLLGVAEVLAKAPDRGLVVVVPVVLLGVVEAVVVPLVGVLAAVVMPRFGVLAVVVVVVPAHRVRSSRIRRSRASARAVAASSESRISPTSRARRPCNSRSDAVDRVHGVVRGLADAWLRLCVVAGRPQRQRRLQFAEVTAQG